MQHIKAAKRKRKLQRFAYNYIAPAITVILPFLFIAFAIFY